MENELTEVCEHKLSNKEVNAKVAPNGEGGYALVSTDKKTKAYTWTAITHCPFCGKKFRDYYIEKVEQYPTPFLWHELGRYSTHIRHGMMRIEEDEKKKDDEFEYFRRHAKRCSDIVIAELRKRGDRPEMVIKYEKEIETELKSVGWYEWLENYE